MVENFSATGRARRVAAAFIAPAGRSGPVRAQPVLFVNELWCNAGMKTGNQFNTVALVGRSNTPGIAEPLATLAGCIAKLGFDVVFEADTAREIGISGYPALTPAEIGARATSRWCSAATARCSASAASSRRTRRR
jgi:NAD+ kinase